MKNYILLILGLFLSNCTGINKEKGANPLGRKSRKYLVENIQGKKGMIEYDTTINGIISYIDHTGIYSYEERDPTTGKLVALYRSPQCIQNQIDSVSIDRGYYYEKAKHSLNDSLYYYYVYDSLGTEKFIKTALCQPTEIVSHLFDLCLGKDTLSLGESLKLDIAYQLKDDYQLEISNYKITIADDKQQLLEIADNKYLEEDFVFEKVCQEKGIQTLNVRLSYQVYSHYNKKLFNKDIPFVFRYIVI